MPLGHNQNGSPLIVNFMLCILPSKLDCKAVANMVEVRARPASAAGSTPGKFLSCTASLVGIGLNFPFARALVVAAAFDTNPDVVAALILTSDTKCRLLFDGVAS